MVAAPVASMQAAHREAANTAAAVGVDGVDVEDVY